MSVSEHITSTFFYFPSNISGNMILSIEYQRMARSVQNNEYMVFYSFYYQGKCPATCVHNDRMQIFFSCRDENYMYITGNKSVPLFPILIPTNIFNSQHALLCRQFDKGEGLFLKEKVIISRNNNINSECAKKECNLWLTNIETKWTGKYHWGCQNVLIHEQFVSFHVGPTCYIMPRDLSHNISWMEANNLCLEMKATLAVFHTITQLEQVKTKISHIHNLSPVALFFGLCKEVGSLYKL